MPANSKQQKKFFNAVTKTGEELEESVRGVTKPDPEPGDLETQIAGAKVRKIDWK